MTVQQREGRQVERIFVRLSLAPLASTIGPLVSSAYVLAAHYNGYSETAASYVISLVKRCAAKASAVRTVKLFDEKVLGLRQVGRWESVWTIADVAQDGGSGRNNRYRYTAILR